MRKSKERRDGSMGFWDGVPDRFAAEGDVNTLMAMDESTGLQWLSAMIPKMVEDDFIERFMEQLQ
jgi:hypothetical protein